VSVEIFKLHGFLFRFYYFFLNKRHFLDVVVIREIWLLSYFVYLSIRKINL